MPPLTIERQAFTSTSLEFVFVPEILARPELALALPSAEDVFLQGWKDAIDGNTIPLEELWDGIDAE